MKKLIMPCMDIRHGKVVKGIKFEGVKDVADPVELAKYYDATGADILVFYDIAASVEDKQIYEGLFKSVRAVSDLPLVAGGGLKTIEDVDNIIKLGADMVSINTGAIDNPELLNEAVEKIGSENVILSVDAKKVNGEYHVFRNAGMMDTGLDALEWISEGYDRGAGILVLNSIDTDGVKAGYDIEMLKAAGEVTDAKIVASGGAGKMQDFKEALMLPKVEVALAASVFHYKEIVIDDLKEYLRKEGIDVNS